ncbi:hypothetical protein [uncultured Kushneria sp.]|uniref:hypothetical protein n=1 Tax=uncultured Kushneria sp. TaxID=905033 RepID=UPI002619622A|nr:hypothetical protein [uncultured Kushneria sp.]
MMTITSPAGRRLARAKSALDLEEEADALFDPRRLRIARLDFETAAREVADELIEQRFHLCEGND